MVGKRRGGVLQVELFSSNSEIVAQCVVLYVNKNVIVYFFICCFCAFDWIWVFSKCFFLLTPDLFCLTQVLYAPPARDRFTAPSFMQRDHFSRFQPTYPYMQHQIDLPPTISLSDGEEPPPYQGPCTLQLRDPEQQMELNRESVRAPPNRTIYDSDLIDMGGGGGMGAVKGGGGGIGGGGPRPPSSNSGISAANSSSHGRMEGPPPAYSEVMGHYPGSAFFLHQHSNNQRVGRPGGPGSRTIQQQSQSECTIVPTKDGKPEDLVWVEAGGTNKSTHPRLRTFPMVTPLVGLWIALLLWSPRPTLPCTTIYQHELQLNKESETQELISCLNFLGWDDFYFPSFLKKETASTDWTFSVFLPPWHDRSVPGNWGRFCSVVFFVLVLRYGPGSVHKARTENPGLT